MKRDPDCTCLLNQLGNIKVTDPWCKVHGDGVLRIDTLNGKSQKLTTQDTIQMQLDQFKKKGWL